MNLSGDSTSVLQMKKDWDSFLLKASGDGNQQTRARYEVEQRNVTGRLNFDSPILLNSQPVRVGRTTEPVQSQLEKQRKDSIKEAELITSKGLVSQLQAQVASLQTYIKAMKIENDKDLDLTKQKYQRELDRFTELKLQLQFLAEREQQATDKAEQYRVTLDSTKTSYESKVFSLQKEKLLLESQLQELEDTSRNDKLELKNQLTRQETETQICKNEVEETKTQLRMHLKRSADTVNQMHEVEEYKLKAEKANHKVLELEQKLEQLNDDVMLNRTMRHQISQVPELEKTVRRLSGENKLLRDTNDNNMLLREKASGLEAKLGRAEKRCEDYTTLQLECQDLQRQLEQWNSMNIPGCKGFQSPSQLVKKVAELQNGQLLMLDKQGKLQSGTHVLEETLRARDHQLTQVNSQLLREEQKALQNVDLVKRLQRKLLLVTKERDGYKRIIDSYESEVTVNVSHPSNVTSRVQQLEDTMQSYHRQTESLEKEVEAKSQMAENLKIKCNQLEYKVQILEQKSNMQSLSTSEEDQKIILQLREKISELEKSLGKIVEEKDILDARLERHHLQGDYDPTKMKVLHFTMNPAAIAHKQKAEELESVKEENDKLKQRLKILEESGGQQVQDLTMQVQEKLQEPSTGKEIEDLKGRLTSAELKNKRLMEAFKRTSQEFREVCYTLTGYKIDISTSNYRLMSMYAESPSDYLLFQQSSNGDMQLLSTDFSSTMTHHIETYLQNADSIPAFLSSITLDLFSRQTMMIG